MNRGESHPLKETAGHTENQQRSLIKEADKSGVSPNRWAEVTPLTFNVGEIFNGLLIFLIIKRICRKK